MVSHGIRGKVSSQVSNALAEFSGSVGYDAVLVKRPAFLREDQIRETLTFFQAVADRIADLVVADRRPRGCPGAAGMRLDLRLPPLLVLLGSRRVVTVTVDDHGVPTFTYNSRTSVPDLDLEQQIIIRSFAACSSLLRIRSR